MRPRLVVELIRGAGGEARASCRAGAGMQPVPYGAPPPRHLSGRQLWPQHTGPVGPARERVGVDVALRSGRLRAPLASRRRIITHLLWMPSF